MKTVARLSVLIVALIACTTVNAEGPRLQKSFVAAFDLHLLAHNKFVDDLTKGYEAWRKENPNVIIVGTDLTFSQPQTTGHNSKGLLTIEYLEADPVKVSLTPKIFLFTAVSADSKLLLEKNDEAVNTWVKEHPEYGVVGRKSYLIHFLDQLQFLQLVLLELQPTTK